ncbi:MAG: 50S ribosomal protein L35 [Peptoniphilaceae bacterium]|nr:50S ribosomal protein L35 [Peptoniphilaceae bacterium]MDD7383284.1 50S ribosomal protein L35 [Peptoniphilaceae bacterium]MDY3738345.1 50S ribosomal protein L35 [Peptoniphilaceae bacterium]
MANKIKTHRATAKRFRVTGSGKIRRFKAYKGHLTGKKSAKRKRSLRQGTIASKGDTRVIKKLLHV